MSSITATPSRNATSAAGAREPRAASAAEGEGDVGGHRDPPAARALAAAGDGRGRSSTGSTIPPTAANAGSSAAWRVESSPTASSRFTSSPTTRKKIVIRPSLTTCWRFSTSENEPTRSVTSVLQKSS